MSTATPWRHLLRASGGIIFGKVRCRCWCLARCFFVAGKLLGQMHADFVQTLISLEVIIWVAWGYCQLTGTYNTIVFPGQEGGLLVRVWFTEVAKHSAFPSKVASFAKFKLVTYYGVCVWYSSRHQLQFSTISCCNEVIRYHDYCIRDSDAVKTVQDWYYLNLFHHFGAFSKSDTFFFGGGSVKIRITFEYLQTTGEPKVPSEYRRIPHVAYKDAIQTAAWLQGSCRFPSWGYMPWN